MLIVIIMDHIVMDHIIMDFYSSLYEYSYTMDIILFLNTIITHL